jgi:hypothetical protein
MKEKFTQVSSFWHINWHSSADCAYCGLELLASPISSNPLLKQLLAVKKCFLILILCRELFKKSPQKELKSSLFAIKLKGPLLKLKI